MRVRAVKGIMVCLIPGLLGSCASVGMQSPPDNGTAPLPELLGVQPPAGPSTGGRVITVQGHNFPKDAVVKFNDVIATDIRVISEAEITVTLPPSAGKVGKATVSVIVSDGRSATNSNMFAYYYGKLDFPVQTQLRTGSVPRGLALKDVNGDGLADLLTANGGESSVSLFLGQQGGNFAGEVKIPVPAGLSTLNVSDINADSRPDLIVASDANSTVYTLLNSGGSPPFSSFASTTVGQGPVAIALGDFDSDSKPDAAVANQVASSVSVLVNNGSGAWTPTGTLAGPVLPFGVASGDVNGDGKVDLAVCGYQASVVQLLLNSGSNQFTMGPTLNVGTSPRGVSLTDLNGDGLMDVQAISETGGVSVLLGRTGGTFSDARSYSTGSFPLALLVQDINGDGMVDLVVASGGGRAISILPGQGDGTFADAQTIDVGVVPSSIDLSDINGDGKLDIAVSSSANGMAYVLMNKSE